MRSTITRLFILILFIFSSFRIPANPLQVADDVSQNELWLDFGFRKNIDNNFSVGFNLNALNEISYRINNYERYLEGSLRYTISESFFVDALFRRASSENGNGLVNIEPRPQIKGTYKFKLGAWLFRTGHRYEWRFIDHLNVKNRYRTDLKIQAPVKLSALNLSPWLRQEFFFSEQDFNQSRSYLGLRGHVKSAVPAVYLMLRSYKTGSSWIQKLIMGLSV